MSCYKFMQSLLAFTLLASLQVRAEILEDLKPQDYERLAPAFLFDRVGFQKAKHPSIEAISQRGFQLKPLVRAIGNSFDFIGMKIPRSSFSQKTQEAQNKIPSGFIITGKARSNFLGEGAEDELNEASWYLKEMNTNLLAIPLKIMKFNGEVFAIDASLDIVAGSGGSSQGYFLQVGGGSSSRNTFNVMNINSGQRSFFHVQLGELGERFGINQILQMPLDRTINSLFANFRAFGQPMNPDNAFFRSMTYMPFLAGHFGSSFEDKDTEELEGLPELPVRFRSASYFYPGWILPFKFDAKPQTSDFSSELQRIQRSLSENLEQESQWANYRAQAMASTPTYADDELSDLVQEICDQIAMTYEAPKELWPQCDVAASLSPNAWAYPGGGIFVSAGLIGLLSSVDGLVHVLGHEVAHVMARHSTKLYKTSVGYNYIGAALGLAATTMTLSSTSGYWADDQFLQWFGATMAHSEGIGRTLSPIMSTLKAGIMAYSRANEFQSDRLGHEVAYSLGTNQENMEKSWQEFAQFNRDYFPQVMSIGDWLMQSHPDMSRRARRIDKAEGAVSKGLGTFHQANSIPQEWRDKYSVGHEKLRPYLEQWADQLSQQKTNRSRLRYNHHMHSFNSAGGRCVFHALGGA